MAKEVNVNEVKDVISTISNNQLILCILYASKGSNCGSVQEVCTEKLH